MAAGQASSSSSESNQISNSINTTEEMNSSEEDGTYVFQRRKSRTVRIISSSTVPTENRFQALTETTGEEEEDEDNQRATKKKFFPPIVLHMENVKEKDLTEMRRQLQGEYIAEYIPEGIKVKTTTQEDYDKIIQTANLRKIGYYTYDADTRKFARYVLRGLPPDFNSNTIQNELAGQGADIIRVRQITRNVTNEETRSREKIPLPLWVITIPKAQEEINKLKNITGIMNFRTRIEDYRGQSGLQQCFKCQKYGHKANFCFLDARCVKCAGKHNTRDCKKQINEAPKCANCEEAHPANFRGCKAAEDFKKKVDRKQIKQQAPNSDSFPNLPKKENNNIPGFPKRAEPSSSSEATQNTEDNEDCSLADIFKIFTSGKIKKYVRKIKETIAKVNKQTDTMNKLITLCTGVMEMFDLEDD